MRAAAVWAQLATATDRDGVPRAPSHTMSAAASGHVSRTRFSTAMCVAQLLSAVLST